MAEFEALKLFMERGGSILYLAGEGGESSYNTNFNYLLEEYGIMVNADSVTRTVYYKYFHPKEVFVSNGVLNRELNKAAGKRIGSGKGKLVVIGSGIMFSDNYIDREENGKLFDVLIQFCTSDKITLNSIDASEPDISDYHYLPDTSKLSEVLRCGLQESEDLPKDFTTLFDVNLFRFDTGLIPKAVKLYEEIRLKHEPLSLIQPQYYIRECGDILGITELLAIDKRDARHILDSVFRSVVGWKKLNQ
ncbi:Intraflagellar transport protein 52 [Irineochytrium annulatum]|nr:Intraflagellar transport protein 52 [Irineochytrium annulatum]